MSHKCSKCGKMLSSLQALNYHMTSKSCNGKIQQFTRFSKLSRDSKTHIVCNLNGTIHSITTDSKDLNEIEYIGYPVYSLMKTVSDKYCFSRHHIDTLLNIDEGCHNFFVNDLSKVTEDKMRTVIFKESDSKIHVFQFEMKEGKVSPRSSLGALSDS